MQVNLVQRSQRSENLPSDDKGVEVFTLQLLLLDLADDGAQVLDILGKITISIHYGEYTLKHVEEYIRDIDNIKSNQHKHRNGVTQVGYKSRSRDWPMRFCGETERAIELKNAESTHLLGLGLLSSGKKGVGDGALFSRILY